MNNNYDEAIEHLDRNLLDGFSKPIAINSIKIAQILQNNMHHVTDEVCGGWPDGNVLIGMTHEDYEEICRLMENIT